MDFFGEEEKKSTKKTDINWDNFDKKYKNNKRMKKSSAPIITALLVVVALIGGILIGAFYFPSSFNSEILSYTVDTIRDNYYISYTDEELGEMAANALADSLDPYSYKMSYDDLKELIDSTDAKEKEAMGITVSKLMTYSPCFITDVSLNSPAYHAGLKAGYQILKVDTTDVGEFTAEELVSLCKETMLDGVTLTCRITKADGTYEDKDFSLKGEVFNIQTVAYYIDASHYQYVDPSMGKAISSDTAYIKLTEFMNTAPQDFMNAMGLFIESGKNKLILDLRDNGGGSVSMLELIANYFVKPEEGKDVGKLCLVKYQDGEEYFMTESGISKNDHKNSYIEGLEIAVIVNENTASASEILTHAIMEYNPSAQVVGVTSYGKEIMQSTAPLIMNTELGCVYLTTAQIYGPISNESLHGIGITPSKANYVLDKNGDLDFRYYRNLRLEDCTLDSQLLKANEALH